MPLPAPGSVVGVIHLLPLPGGPGRSPGAQVVVDRALRDAEALVEGGAAAAIVENLGDAPFEAGPVEPHVVAFLTRVAVEVGQRFGQRLPLGVNALRNDAEGALGVAAAAGAWFVRVNVHVGVMVTDQGLVTGQARRTLLYRARVAPAVAIVADVLVKHAVPVGPVDLGQVAHDTFHRGGADALVVSGSGTGRPTSTEHLRRVREAVPEAPLWLGSGLVPDTARLLRELCDVAIVGTALHEEGRLDRPLHPGRVRAVVEAFGA